MSIRWKYDLILSDIHIPFYDKKLIDKIIRYIKKEYIEIETIYLNGDIIDFVQLSKFNKKPERFSTIQDDINLTKKFILQLINKIRPKNIVYILGNHEYRLISYLLTNAVELYNLANITFENLFDINFNIKFIKDEARESFIKTPYGLYIGHFRRFSKMAGRAAQLITKDRNVSIVQGHTHKVGSGYTTGLDGKLLESYECGCLCNISDITYVNNPNWQQGFAVIKWGKIKNEYIYFYNQFLIKKINNKYMFY